MFLEINYSPEQKKYLKEIKKEEFLTQLYHSFSFCSVKLIISFCCSEKE